MPEIINILIARAFRLIKELFAARSFDTGSLELSWQDNGNIVQISTSDNVMRVWFYLMPTDDPYLEHGNMAVLDGVNQSLCFVSNATAVPGGFTFQVNIPQGGYCVVRWLAILGDE